MSKSPAVGGLILLCAFGCTSAARDPAPIHAEPQPATETTHAVVSDEPLRSDAPYTLTDDKGRAIEVYPPLDPDGKRPLVVALHATCMQPSSVCDGFGHAARDVGWLVCPSGNSTCFGEPDWSGTGPAKASFMSKAIAQIAERERERIGGPGVLFGWSRGAFAARDILYTGAFDATNAKAIARFRGLVLMAAAVTPDASKLKSAGITRVVMAAGDVDGSAATMRAATATLRNAGLETRYVSLGKIGHVWPDDFEARMAGPIAWAAGAAR